MMALFAFLSAAAVGLGLPALSVGDSRLTALADMPAASATVETGPADKEIIKSVADINARMTVPVTIEGQGPFLFMIDTGSQATAVTRGLRDRLQLKAVGSATVVGMASRVTVQLVEIGQLEFAARTIERLSVPLLEEQHLGADGILGLDSLQDLRVMIDFRDDTISVSQSEPASRSRGYEIVVKARRRLGRLIITNARVNGVKTAVIIDTGAQTSIANLALERRLRKQTKLELAGYDVNGKTLTGRLGTSHSLTIGAMSIDNMPIAFTDSPAFDALDLGDQPALVLGMTGLRLFDRVAIDFSKRKVQFDLPSKEPSRKQFRHGVSGIEI